MTDIDSMHRHVQNLLRFTEDAKEAIAFFKVLKTAGGSIPVPAEGAKLPATALEERLTAIEGAAADDRRDLTTIDDRLDRLEAFKGDVVPALDMLAAVGGLQALSGLGAMVAWFNQNQEALELLLSFNDDPPAEPPGNVAGPVEAAGTIIAGPDGATGSVSPAPAPDVPAPPTPPMAPPDSPAGTNPQDQPAGTTG